MDMKLLQNLIKKLHMLPDDIEGMDKKPEAKVSVIDVKTLDGQKPDVSDEADKEEPSLDAPAEGSAEEESHESPETEKSEGDSSDMEAIAKALMGGGSDDQSDEDPEAYKKSALFQKLKRS